MDIELVTDAQSMVLDCFEAYLQQIGDFLGRSILGNQFQDAPLCRGQVLQLRFA